MVLYAHSCHETLATCSPKASLTSWVYSKVTELHSSSLDFRPNSLNKRKQGLTNTLLVVTWSKLRTSFTQTQIEETRWCFLISHWRLFCSSPPGPSRAAVYSALLHRDFWQSFWKSVHARSVLVCCDGLHCHSRFSASIPKKDQIL